MGEDFNHVVARRRVSRCADCLLERTGFEPPRPLIPSSCSGVRTAAVVSNDNSAGVALYDTAGRPRAALIENPAGDAVLVLYDSTGRRTASPRYPELRPKP